MLSARQQAAEIGPRVRVPGALMIGDHNSAHSKEGKRLRDGTVAGDAALVVVALAVSAGTVIALIVALVLWGTS